MRRASDSAEQWLKLADGGGRGLCAALLGGGGKSALLERLGRELARRHRPVLITSLTTMSAEQARGARTPESALREGLEKPARGGNPVVVLGTASGEGKVAGIDPGTLEQLHRRAAATVFECDGARHRPLKAHNDRDPMVPEFATHVIVVVGADAVGTTPAGGRVHRPELFARRWDVKMQTPLDAAMIARVLTAREGYMAKVPAGVPTVFFVNKADAFPEAARTLAGELVRLGRGAVFFGSVREGWLEEGA